MEIINFEKKKIIPLTERASKKHAGEFNCLGKHKEKYITFSVPIKKEIEIISSRRKEIKLKILSFKLKFIDSARFMASSLKNLVDNLA